MDPFVFFVGFLVVLNIMSIWTFSGLPIRIFKALKLVPEHVFTNEEFEDYMSIKWGFWGELLTCTLCLSTHLSSIVGLVFVLTGLASWWLPIVAMLTYPTAVLYVHNQLKR